ncbi:MAG: class B sortase [Eubacteriales bacterium]|nr:class B sortase [Eubacteriales bacterium]
MANKKPDKKPNKKPKKKSKVGDILLTLILIIAIGVFCYAAYNLYHIYTEYKKGTDEYNKIEQMAVTNRDPDKVQEETGDTEEQGSSLVAPMKIDFATLRGVNEDVIGWIYVEALDGVSYPVVKGSDNSTYLHMTYERNYNFAGTIFIDCENSGDFNDCNTLVYGHNMKNGSMFGQLRKFSQDAETYKKSKYFWIFTPDKDYRYEIISAYTTGVNSDTYTLFKGPGTEFEEYLEKIKGRSEIQTDAGEMTIRDKIVTLSTCTGNESTRFVVQGRRVDELDVQ